MLKHKAMAHKKKQKRFVVVVMPCNVSFSSLILQSFSRFALSSVETAKHNVRSPGASPYGIKN